MHIIAVGRAHPPHSYSQQDILARIQAHWGSSARESDKMTRLHEATTVQARHTALPIDEYPALQHFGHSNDVFIRVGMDVATLAIEQALEKSGLRASDVDALFFSSVTGIAVPTIDARLIHLLGFRDDVKRFPFFGLGCVAGAAGTARMHDYLLGHPEQVTLLVCLELCSLTFQQNDYEVPNLVGTGLFGDGCAAMIAAGAKSPHAAKAQGPAVLASKSRIYPDSERIMGWDISEKGFKIVLSSGVPDIVKRYLGDDIDTFLAQHKLTRADITSWVCHPGGPKVIDAIIETMNLEEYDLAITRESLRSVGNMSSASVLFVLGQTIESRRPSNGEYGLLMAMGPGFVSELVLIRW
jgi:alkylresorcinol/alkylpyrone synthase